VSRAHDDLVPVAIFQTLAMHPDWLLGHEVVCELPHLLHRSRPADSVHPRRWPRHRPPCTADVMKECFLSASALAAGLLRIGHRHEGCAPFFPGARSRLARIDQGPDACEPCRERAVAVVGNGYLSGINAHPSLVVVVGGSALAERLALRRPLAGEAPPAC